MNLQEALDNAHASQKELADYLRLGRSTVSRLVTSGVFPVGQAVKIRCAVNTFLTERGVSPKGLWGKVSQKADEGAWLPLENEMISKEARKIFGISRDPFIEDVRGAEDVYMNADTRFASEYMFSTAKLGGMLAVIGDSGSGKTTLRRLLVDRIKNEEIKIKVIFPRVIDKGRLTASGICDAIIADVSNEKPKRTLEAKARQIERLLRDSLLGGWRHALIIEEAHDLTIQTLKYLKRFWELEYGFEKLLSIILIGQPELKEKLDEGRNWEAREIIRRMEIAELGALENQKDLQGYVELKLHRVGMDISCITDDAYQAILLRLTRQSRSGRSVCLAYPLTVNNLIKRAMNIAASLGEKTITREIMEAV